MSGALGRRAFSCGPPLLLFGVMSSSRTPSKDPLVVKLHCVGLQHFAEREGLSEQRPLGWFRFHANLVADRVLPGVGVGSEARGEGLHCSHVCCCACGSGYYTCVCVLGHPLLL